MIRTGSQASGGGMGASTNTTASATSATVPVVGGAEDCPSTKSVTQPVARQSTSDTNQKISLALRLLVIVSAMDGLAFTVRHFLTVHQAPAHTPTSAIVALINACMELISSAADLTISLIALVMAVIWFRRSMAADPTTAASQEATR